ncbi:MAG TPA: hypothetical protein VHF22_11275 [Planctomycetota bacterium]|nr:hypothetical protein [Planctomycetota bacterium]
MTATPTSEKSPDTFEIRIDGDGGAHFTCRRPTHGELDLAMLSRLLQVVVGYQRKIAAVEDEPQTGSAVKVANHLALCAEAIEEIATRVKRGLRAIAPPDAVEWLGTGDELTRARRAVEVAVALIVALAPAGRLPK